MVSGPIFDKLGLARLPSERSLASLGQLPSNTGEEAGDLVFGMLDVRKESRGLSID